MFELSISQSSTKVIEINRWMLIDDCRFLQAMGRGNEGVLIELSKETVESIVADVRGCLTQKADIVSVEYKEKQISCETIEKTE